MLQNIRERSQSWIAKVIIGAVVIALALFGVESLIGLFGQSSDEVARVNGQPISRQALETTVQRAIRSGQIAPEQERELRGQVLDQYIVQRLMNSYAEDNGMAVSDQQLDQLIVSLPEFHDTAGKFDRQLYLQRLGQMGYTPLAFRDQLRETLLNQQIQQGLTVSDFDLPDERKRLIELQTQARTFRYHTLTATDLESPVEISDAEVSAYYAEHQQDFLRPEQVKLDYVLLDRKALMDKTRIDEDELRAEWKSQRSEAPRTVSHIMVTFGDNRSRDQAMAIIDKVKQRLAAGDSFAELAAEYSDDSISADHGGDMGELVRGSLGLPEFDEAAFALGEGEVSDVVETDSGLHLIKVTSINQQPFEAVRDQLAERRIDSLFDDKAHQLIEESYSRDELASVADILGLQLQQSGWVGRDGATGTLAEPGVMEAAFSPEVLEEGYNSEVIELDADRHLVLRVTDHRDATTLPLEEVKGQVAEELRKHRIHEALQSLAEQRIAQLRSGETLDIEWQHADGVTRQQNQLPEAMVQAVFRLPHPEAGAVVYGSAVDGDRVSLIALDEVAQGETSEYIESLLSGLHRRAAVEAWVEYLQQSGDIEIR